MALLNRAERRNNQAGLLGSVDLVAFSVSLNTHFWKPSDKLLSTSALVLSGLEANASCEDESRA